MSIKSADGAEETDGNDNDNRRRGSVSQSVSQKIARMLKTMSSSAFQRNFSRFSGLWLLYDESIASPARQAQSLKCIVCFPIHRWFEINSLDLACISKMGKLCRCHDLPSRVPAACGSVSFVAALPRRMTSQPDACVCTSVLSHQTLTSPIVLSFRI